VSADADFTSLGSFPIPRYLRGPMSKRKNAPCIRLRGVRHNNLKGFDLDLPLNRLIVVTGLSGSGKSSLAFDTLYAEGQRRYIETFSPYTRQFFDRMDKPQVDSIEGIPPAIAIEQRNAVKTTRSTVGTMTEICEHMKQAWPLVATLFCRKCNQPVTKESPQIIWETVQERNGDIPVAEDSVSALEGASAPNNFGAAEEFSLSPRERAGVRGNDAPEVLVTFDLPLTKKLPLKDSLELIAKQGYQRLLVQSRTGLQPVPAGARGVPSAITDSEDHTLGLRETTTHEYRTERDREPAGRGSSASDHADASFAGKMPATRCTILRLEHAPEFFQRTPPELLTVIQDRVKLTPANRARFVEACEQAYHFGKGHLQLYWLGEPVGDGLAMERSQNFSKHFHCATCDLEYREPTPALFSFNHPLGACPTCKGFGRVIQIDYNLAIPDRSLSLNAGAVKPWRTGTGAESQKDLAKFCKKRGVPMDVPFRELPEATQRWVIDGDVDYGKDKDHQWPTLWYGVKGYFRWLETKAYKMHVRVLLSKYRAYVLCPDCQGNRLQAEALLYRVVMERWSAPRQAGEQARLDAAIEGELERRQPEPVSLELRASPPPSPRLSPLGRGSDYDSPSRSRGITERLVVSTAADGVPLSPGERAGVRGTGAAEVSTPADLEIGAPRSMSLPDFYRLSLRDALQVIDSLIRQYAPKPHEPLSLVLGEVRQRLRYLDEIGLGYLTLDRPTRSLSGGETERVNLTSCLGSRLVNTLYVLDEPSVGLHPRDTARLVKILESLRDAGNTVVVVEHEEGVMRAADQIIDLGPGHGESGGQLVFQGDFKSILKAKGTLTGDYLSSRRAINVGQVSQNLSNGASKVAGGSSLSENAPAPRDRFSKTCPTLHVTNASKHNLQNLSVEIPLGRLVCITGVSGSGKSTLVRDVLVPLLAGKLGQNEDLAASRDKDADGTEGDEEGESSVAGDAQLSGAEHLRRFVLVDQSAIGRTPRSNPAVYIGAFDEIRELFAQTDEAKRRGYNASSFSFNSAQGQCDRCRGAGFEKIEMQFLSDVFIKCPACNGRRYREHILEVRIQGSEVRGQKSGDGKPASEVRSQKKEVGGLRRPTAGGAKPKTQDPRHQPLSFSIADLLEATVDAAIEFLGALPESRQTTKAVNKLRLLQEVGLGYLRLGQPINTLSGGECQRLKLVSHLAEAERVGGSLPPNSQSAETTGSRVPDQRGTLFIFDEPTTGLHFEDVRILLLALRRLVDAGHSVLVVEHHLDVVRNADWVIDLGPGAGDEGGRLVAAGMPEEIARCEASFTGHALQQLARH
jgi:excinuclease ABC subunit A